jgi:sulfur-oxidizing protein SoxZ
VIRTRILMPAQAARGEIIDIRVQMLHPMERGGTGLGGRELPRRIINLFFVRYNGDEIFRMELFTGISPNPFIAFTTRAVTSGELVFTWVEDGGEITTRTEKLSVT